MTAATVPANMHALAALRAAADCLALLDTLGARIQYIGLTQTQPAQPLLLLAEAGDLAGYLDAQRTPWKDCGGSAMLALRGCLVVWPTAQAEATA